MTSQKRGPSYRKKRVYPGSKPAGTASVSTVLSSSLEKLKKILRLVLLISLSAGGLYVYQKYFQSSDKVFYDLDQEAMELVEESVRKRTMDLRLERAVQLRDILQEKNKEPVSNEKISAADPAVVDLGVEFSDNENIKKIIKKVDEDPLKNDVYENPDNEIRRQIVQKELQEKFLAEQKEREQRAFLEDFVQRAEEQGYSVEITEDMEAVIKPAPEKPKEETEEEFERIKIDFP